MSFSTGRVSFLFFFFVLIGIFGFDFLFRFDRFFLVLLRIGFVFSSFFFRFILVGFVSFRFFV
ncbi:hypothetical protein HanRHA438_Chr11g0517981 [Helianthus annuus]|nr:hypothetical protein HanRHA438_Chr11g0517981 [Helianthus annuus]